ncbi:hypothetical protein TEA_017441 [Camellia sinensis var. sinensis]|uniref:Uncharacterized protein n=1 Tax=Camellia sinensis var. sinensis TaxID=542762 RepID=A0A4S4EG39_CAMSN|nr:hypothetical protein TEA_017441 [Camellia sinensis var. sinensis]
MASSSNLSSFLLFLLSLFSLSTDLALGHESSRGRREEEEVGIRGRRVLMGFKETPSGGNVTFDCSPSGPCVACVYSEKNDEKYRCSETGYRIPLKCVKIEAGTNQVNSKKAQPNRSTLENNSAKEKLHVMLHNAEESYTSIRQRSLLADSSTSVGGSQPYITYRSCIPPINEEKLSVIGFEGIILGLLLISSSLIYFRRKQSSVAAGVGAMRIPTNSRLPEAYKPLTIIQEESPNDYKVQKNSGGKNRNLDLLGRCKSSCPIGKPHYLAESFDDHMRTR